MPVRSLLARWLVPALVTLVAAALPGAGAEAQQGVVRGVVTDSAGTPLRGVEVFAIRTDRSTRTDAQGRFTLTRLPWGQSVVMARSPGYRAAERAVTIGDDGLAEVSFQLGRVIQIIDTLRITSHDGCAGYSIEGFECRRRAGIGQFRGPEELHALRPHHWADMFDGLTGLRRTQYVNPQRELDWTVMSTTGWRCLNISYNGREPTAREELIRVQDIYAIEHYDVYEKVPAIYKRISWPGSSPQPCAIIIYWTKAFVEENGPPKRP